MKTKLNSDSSQRIINLIKTIILSPEPNKKIFEEFRKEISEKKEKFIKLIDEIEEYLVEANDYKQLTMLSHILKNQKVPEVAFCGIVLETQLRVFGKYDKNVFDA